MKEKLEEHKSKVIRRKERKNKWENWKKTQALFYRKTSTNYKKWDCFELDSDTEEEQEPIVPKDDP